MAFLMPAKSSGYSHNTPSATVKHSFKYAAQLQASDTGDAPKLIRIDSKAGHGGGKPTSKRIEEAADIYSFIFNNMNITPKTE